MKVLPGDLRDPELVRMFNAEADVLAHLSAHPSIVTVYQAGISADGRPYIVMEYCPGSLAQRYRIERIPVEEVLAIGVKMASALESAHRAGLVHRDVKPSNILVTSFGVPVLADFGIASSLARALARRGVRDVGPVERPRGRRGADAGHDRERGVGLGATVYSLLAGHSPFERLDRGQNTREHLRRRILRATYTRIARPDVPDALQDVLAVAMSRDPATVRERPRLRRGAASGAGASSACRRRRSRSPSAEWVAGDPGIDFADAGMRGPAPSRSSTTPSASAPAPTPSQAGPRETPSLVAGRRGAAPHAPLGPRRRAAVAAVAGARSRGRC